MLVAQFDHNVEVNQVSAQHYEVSRDGKVVWESKWKDWNHDDNYRGAHYEAQRQVKNAEMVAEMTRRWADDN